MDHLKKRLMEAIDYHQDELVTLLSELVSFKTVSPPARNTVPL